MVPLPEVKSITFLPYGPKITIIRQKTGDVPGFAVTVTLLTRFEAGSALRKNNVFDLPTHLESKEAPETRPETTTS